MLSLHGISKDAWKRYSSEGSWYYEVLFAGFKYNMTDIQAALGLHQLERLEGFIETRARYAAMYNEAFAEMPELHIPLVNEGVRHAWHLYVIQLEPGAADDQPRSVHRGAARREYRHQRPFHPRAPAPLLPAHLWLQPGRLSQRRAHL